MTGSAGRGFESQSVPDYDPWSLCAIPVPMGCDVNVANLQHPGLSSHVEQTCGVIQRDLAIPDICIIGIKFENVGV